MIFVQNIETRDTNFEEWSEGYGYNRNTLDMIVKYPTMYVVWPIDDPYTTSKQYSTFIEAIKYSVGAV